MIAARSLTLPPKGLRVHTADVIQAIAQLVGALGITGIAFKYAPLFLDRVQLVKKLQSTEKRAELAESTLEAFQNAANGWELVRREMAELRTQFGSAVLYISELVVHIRDGGTSTDMPPVPADLQEAVTVALERRG